MNVIREKNSCKNTYKFKFLLNLYVFMIEKEVIQ